MARTGTRRPRDREAGPRSFDALDPAIDRVFRMTEAGRQQVAQCLRHIDDARRALESQHNPDNREIIRELRASADRIYDLVNDLEESNT